MENLVFERATLLEFIDKGLEVPSQPEFLPCESDLNQQLAKDILKTVFQFRRVPSSHLACDPTCSSCHSPHLSKVISAIASEKPITLVLPSFPGKSPNLSKVLGPLPDMAERLALQFLDRLCEKIREIYPPGARMVLCSDGRVFSDIVGMREADVTAYHDELGNMIDELGLVNISTFDLDEVCEGKDYIQMRIELMERFGMSVEELRSKVLRGSKEMSHPDDCEANRMYCGITRFLVEDSTFEGQTKSRSSIQRECKVKAYEVIRRSNAWSEFISQRFPEAVRLSIHPQTCGSRKLGIRLVGNESWMTPWHGAAVKTNEGFILLKRSEAEALGAQLAKSEKGRPSHFVLMGTEVKNEI